MRNDDVQGHPNPDDVLSFTEPEGIRPVCLLSSQVASGFPSTIHLFSLAP